MQLSEVRSKLADVGQKVADAAKPTLGPLPQTTARVLSDEFDAIWGRPAGNAEDQPTFGTERDYRCAVHRRDQAALCLSGGGIRSAAFALGALQALAQKRLLSKFHYLSTVSGGGYAGSWLSRWLLDETSRAPERAVEEVEKKLGGASERRASPLDVDQIEALRKNSNFLTPKLGIASLDTWTAIMLWVRNVLLNWLVFLPALVLLAMVPSFYQSLLVAASGWEATCGVLVLAVGWICLAVSSWAACRYLPAHELGLMDFRRTRRVVNLTVLPAFAWAFLLPFVMVNRALDYMLTGEAVALALLAWAAMLLGYHVAWRGADPGDRPLFSRNKWVWAITALISASLLGLGVHLIEQIPTKPDLHLFTMSLATAGPLWITSSHLLLSTLYVGYRKREIRVGDQTIALNDTQDREWLARISAVQVFPTLLWAMLAAVCLFLPWLIFEQLFALQTWSASIGKTITAITAPISGLIAVLGGKSALSAIDLIATPEEKKKTAVFDLVVNAATVIFAVALLTCLARLETVVAANLWGGDPVADGSPLVPSVGQHVLVALVLGVVLWRAARSINVNRFSLQGVYRNRLIRAFLGGAREVRDANQFTGFDARDDIRMHKLEAALHRTGPDGAKVKRRVLFPVINVTLNLVGGANLAWQERKASSFTISPLACGSATLDSEEPSNPHDPPPLEKRRGAFISTVHYGGDEPDPVPDPSVEGANRGISLGTAMAISGAAASPSQGYHSSPATAFLMTLFNVRLGAWLANPARHLKDELQRSGPAFALWPLASEMFGLADDRGRYLYLSDGGHFENLGVYEMLRRRCRFILVIDADEDRDCLFEDLGNAVRKSFIDLDVEVEFEKLDIKSRKSATATSPAFAIGRIHYPDPDPDPRQPGRVAEPGWLIYLKPSYHIENAPIDVRAYAEANSLFPHESTLDQWFSESQFESYRRLGFYLVSHLDTKRDEIPKITDTTLKTTATTTETPPVDHRTRGGKIAKVTKRSETKKSTQSETGRPPDPPRQQPVETYKTMAAFFQRVTGRKEIVPRE